MSFIITEFPVSIGMNYTEIYQIQEIHGLIIAIILLKTFWKKQTVSGGRADGCKSIASFDICG